MISVRIDMNTLGANSRQGENTRVSITLAGHSWNSANQIILEAIRHPKLLTYVILSLKASGDSIIANR